MKTHHSLSRLALAFLLPLVIMQSSTAFANSYLYKPLKVPKAEDIVAFSNGIAEGGERRAATREQILKFLSSGTNNNNPETWYDKRNSDKSWFTVQCDGVFTDKEGKVYFWTLNNPETLTLLTSDGGQALLQLGK